MGGDSQALGNHGPHLCDGRHLQRVIEGQPRQGIQFRTEQLLGAEEGAEEALFTRQDVAALSDFGVLQVRPDLGDLAFHVQRVAHQIRLSDVARAEPQRQGQDQRQRNRGCLRNAVFGGPRTNEFGQPFRPIFRRDIGHNANRSFRPAGHYAQRLAVGKRSRNTAVYEHQA